MKDYLLTASNGLLLLSFPDFKPILKLHDDEIDFTSNVDLSACGSGAFLKSSDSRFKLIELVNSEKSTAKFRTLQEFEIANAVCCACPKSQRSHNMAFGLADSSVVLTHYENQKMKVLKSKTKEDSLIKCSKYMDFSSDHSQLVSIVEDGLIDVFDINRNKLAFEIKKFKEDIPILAKFRPNGTSHLMCIGYTNGKLKLYDTSAQKVVYKSKENHFSLCKDLCFFKQNYVISIGYDSSVIIHDFRSGISPSVNFLSDHHLNSVAVSADDNYYCVGDYKGNLSSYDMRKSNFTPLSTTNISDQIVKKMIFLQSSAREFYDDTVENIVDKTTVQHHISSKSKSSELLDSFFNFNISNNNDPSVPIPDVCKITTTNTQQEDLDELKCENTFIKNIKARSTCIFEQPPKGIKLIRSPTFEEELNTSDHRLMDIMTRIDNYETQLTEMKSKIRELKSTVVEMNKFIEMFPKFLTDEIHNLQRKTRQSDMLVVEKLSMLCASDPQIVELINFILARDFN